MIYPTNVWLLAGSVASKQKRNQTMPDSASCMQSIADPSAAHDIRWFLCSRLVGREVLEGMGSCVSTAERFSSSALTWCAFWLLKRS